jgi:NADH:ubiquinone reductase (H+-translocating)
LNAEIERVDFGAVVLKGGERYESRTIVWTAGTQPAPFVKRLQLATNAHDAVVTERDFSVPDHPHLWAIGDCAAIPMAGGGTYAPLAQNATREGPLLARNVLARLRGRPTRPFAYQTLGQMASLGDRYAIAQLPHGITLTGLPAWILWRAYYLGRLPGFSSKTRVVLDWTLGLAFGPPTSRVPLVERGDTALEHEITR